MSLSVLARILILEDDSELLEGAGYKVAAASNGAEALNLIKAAGVDLVMVDVTIAGMSGLDVARELRAGEETAHVRIALHTGMKEAAIRAEFSDYDTFMPKGDDADELLRLVAGATTIRTHADPWSAGRAPVDRMPSSAAGRCASQVVQTDLSDRPRIDDRDLGKG